MNVSTGEWHFRQCCNVYFLRFIITYIPLHNSHIWHLKINRTVSLPNCLEYPGQQACQSARKDTKVHWVCSSPSPGKESSSIKMLFNSAAALELLQNQEPLGLPSPTPHPRNASSTPSYIPPPRSPLLSGLINCWVVDNFFTRVLAQYQQVPGQL